MVIWEATFPFWVSVYFQGLAVSLKGGGMSSKYMLDALALLHHASLKKYVNKNQA